MIFWVYQYGLCYVIYYILLHIVDTECILDKQDIEGISYIVYYTLCAFLRFYRFYRYSRKRRYIRLRRYGI